MRKVERSSTKLNGKRKLNIMERVAELFGIPDEVVMDIPQIIITGDKRIIIENYKSICSFLDNRVIIKSVLGKYEIKGRKLVIEKITHENIYIRGSFEKFEKV